MSGSEFNSKTRVEINITVFERWHIINLPSYYLLRCVFVCNIGHVPKFEEGA